MRLIGDIYSAWLKELCRWFAKPEFWNPRAPAPPELQSQSGGESEKSLVEAVNNDAY